MVSAADTISFDQFQGELSRYFDTAGMTGEAARRLYDAWRAIVGERARELGLRELARGSALDGSHGQAWFEQLRNRDALSDADLIALVVAADTSLSSPPPRPYCPEWLRGRWQLAAVAEDGHAFAPPPRPQVWQLREDGTIEAPGESVDGARWRVHAAVMPELMVKAAGGAAWRRWLVTHHDATTLELIPPGATHRKWRWHRAAA